MKVLINILEKHDMVKRIEGEVWCEDNKLTLSELLAKIPENNLNWYVHYVQVIGIAPHDLSQAEFEEKAMGSVYGYKLSWDELNVLAKNTWDVKDIHLIASIEPIPCPRAKDGWMLYGNELIGYCRIRSIPIKYFACIFDSTSWEIIYF